MDECGRQCDDNQIAVINSEFHSIIEKASGSPHLQAILENVMQRFERYRLSTVTSPARRSESNTEHRAIVEALRAGDTELAEHRAQEHVRHALRSRLNAVEKRNPDRS